MITSFTTVVGDEFQCCVGVRFSKRIKMEQVLVKRKESVHDEKKIINVTETITGYLRSISGRR